MHAGMALTTLCPPVQARRQYETLMQFDDYDERSQMQAMRESTAIYSPVIHSPAHMPVARCGLTASAQDTCWAAPGDELVKDASYDVHLQARGTGEPPRACAGCLIS